MSHGRGEQKKQNLKLYKESKKLNNTLKDLT